jgi:LPS export ABC transporter protein LptC
MSPWLRIAGALGLVAVVAIAFFVGRAGRGDNGTDAASRPPPDPGYAARDAEVIETGYDGRERYRLRAEVVRQKIDSSVIELEQLEMRYRPGAQPLVAGEQAPTTEQAAEVWNLTSDRGEMRANGDDILLTGDVHVTGPAPGGGAPVSLTTTTMRINTPTRFIETDAPVTLRWAGHTMNAQGLEADLNRGSLRLKSNLHGTFTPQ